MRPVNSILPSFWQIHTSRARQQGEQQPKGVSQQILTRPFGLVRQGEFERTTKGKPGLRNVRNAEYNKMWSCGVRPTDGLWTGLSGIFTRHFIPHTLLLLGEGQPGEWRGPYIIYSRALFAGHPLQAARRCVTPAIMCLRPKWRRMRDWSGGNPLSWLRSYWL